MAVKKRGTKARTVKKSPKKRIVKAKPAKRKKALVKRPAKTRRAAKTSKELRQKQELEDLEKARRVALELKEPKTRLEQEIREEICSRSNQMFLSKGPKTCKMWLCRYSPVLITMLVGLATYFWLVFYLFYPQTLLYGHYIQLLILLMFVFFIIGVLVHLGVRAELMFVRIMSFAFVFIIFSFLLVFILLAHSMYG
jgi:hypothetical protein